MGHCFNQSTNLGDCYYTIKVPIFGNCSMQSTFSGHCNRFKHPLKGHLHGKKAKSPNITQLLSPIYCTCQWNPWLLFLIPCFKVFCFCLTLAFYFVHPWLFVIFLCPMSRLVPLADHPPPPPPAPVAPAKTLPVQIFTLQWLLWACCAVLWVGRILEQLSLYGCYCCCA